MWKAAGLIVFLVCVQLAVTNGQQQQSSRFLNANIETSNDGAEGGSSGRRIDACKTKSGLAPHPEYCDEYFECINGQEVQRECPNGLVFVGQGHGIVAGNCHYPFVGDCQGRPKRHQPIQTEHCDWLYGIFGHETSCTRYWTCWNGTSTEQFCIGGLLYNEKTRSCDWPENVEGCQKHPLCKDFPNGNVALGKSCNRYWHCQGGYPRLQRCPAMLVFDKNSLRCVVPPTEDCEVPSTTTEAAQFAEDEENEDIGNNNGVQQQQQQSNTRGNARPQQSQGGGRPIPIGSPIPVGAQRFNPQQAQPLPQFSGLPQLPGGAVPLGNIQQQQQPQRNRFQ